ncbi:MAG TPA: hypothetical protein P5545_02950 [Bacteroidota bacterium]|mgnify:CR=1 FL=1|nr:hypothetical protein [Candidatus Kapabacteria bacterium]HRS01489.1 hypothetical protein [Bacteroidota bacterium]HRT67431.1 hypothetical protein [Bacteroidota bacterium]
MKIKSKIFLFPILILLQSCNEGLSPQFEQKTVLQGKIVYTSGISSWPAKDSLKDLRVVAFKNFPPQNIVQEILSGSAYYTQESLPFYTDTTNFSIEIPDAPVLLKYIAVAQQYGGLMEWRVIGVYKAQNSDTASNLYINKSETKNITIYVDFNNLPPQPF